jgi:hypothetical protein
MDKESKAFLDRFMYEACDYCDEASRWCCRGCGQHFCPDCTEKHTKKACKDGD